MPRWASAELEKVQSRMSGIPSRVVAIIRAGSSERAIRGPPPDIVQNPWARSSYYKRIQIRGAGVSLRECCQIKTRLHRSRDITDWIIPGAILALLRKCPLCLVAYAAVWSAIGLSFS